MISGRCRSAVTDFEGNPHSSSMREWQIFESTKLLEGKKLTMISSSASKNTKIGQILTFIFESCICIACAHGNRETRGSFVQCRLKWTTIQRQTTITRLRKWMEPTYSSSSRRLQFQPLLVHVELKRYMQTRIFDNPRWFRLQTFIKHWSMALNFLFSSCGSFWANPPAVNVL